MHKRVPGTSYFLALEASIDQHTGMRSGALHGLKSFGLIGLLVIALGQSALLLHKSSVDHPTDETCEVCSSCDRQTATPVSAVFQPFDIVWWATLPDRASNTLSTQETGVYRLRDPPIL